MSASNGLEWTDIIFNAGVETLQRTGELLGMTYKEANVWIFFILWPLSMLVLMIETIWLIKIYRHRRLARRE